MVGEVFAGIAGFKSIMDTLKGFKDISDANTRNAIAVELQEKILTAYQAQTALTQKVGELEKEVADFKNWEAEKQRYELKDIGQGCVAYALKDGVQPPEQVHYLCANCYSDSKKNIFKRNVEVWGEQKFTSAMNAAPNYTCLALPTKNTIVARGTNNDFIKGSGQCQNQIFR